MGHQKTRQKEAQMKTTAVCLLLTLVLCPVLISTTLAMPLHPDLVEKLRSEGRLEEERAFMEDAYRRGVNNIWQDQEPPRLRLLGIGESPLTTTRQAIVIIVDFDDNIADTSTYPASHYVDLLFSVGTYPTGSMRDYYLENSYGAFEVTGEVSGWHRMPRDYSYYVDGQRGFGTYPRNAQKLTEDAVAAADPYVDFSQYDNDGPDGIPDSGDDDGYVDALFVVHAGPGYETTGDPNDIHSHAWATSSPVPVDGVWVYRYSMEPEDGKIGVFCHEFGHVLGLPDLYDYGYDSYGVGYWSLMAVGCWGNGGITPVHFDGWSKTELGFVSPIVPSSNLLNVDVPYVEDNPTIYKVWKNWLPGQEYFLMEYRRKIGFDTYMKGSGIVIYHVDEAMDDNDNQRCGPGDPHYLVAVEQADGECDLEYDINSGDSGDPWPGKGGANNPNYAFNEISTPNSNDYEDNSTGISIYGISFLSSSTARVSIAASEVAPYVEVTAPDGGEYYEYGEQMTIEWIAFDNLVVDSVSILLSTDGGATFPNLLASGEQNDGVFTWTVDRFNSSECRIKVVAYDNVGNTAEDISDGDFTIDDFSGIVAQERFSADPVKVVPNPSAGTTRLIFTSRYRSPRVAIYDATGKRIKSLAIRNVGGDRFEATWDGTAEKGSAVGPGVYFARITGGPQPRTTRLTIAH